MKKLLIFTGFALCAVQPSWAVQSAVNDAELRQAPRGSITPQGKRLPPNFTGLIDPIFVRSVVLDNGRRTRPRSWPSMRAPYLPTYTGRWARAAARS
jgi:hypothetical protein